MTYLVRLVKPHIDDLPDGRKSFRGYPLPPGDNWLQQSSDGRAISSTSMAENALRFASVAEALADPEVLRVAEHYAIQTECHDG
jgi:hypothetical protein